MNYSAQDIIDTLKTAREVKGLSQRALSARTGVPQSHISKIESGGADIRLSSLIELARALDLDLRLVPRKALTAVDNVVRSTVPQTAATPAIKELNRTLDTLRNLRNAYPDFEALTKLQSSLQTIKNLDNVGNQLDALHEITRPVRELQKQSESWRKATEETKLSAEQLGVLQELAIAFQSLRNRLVHNVPDAPSLPRPAYSLDEEDGHD